MNKIIAPLITLLLGGFLASGGWYYWENTKPSSTCPEQSCPTTACPVTTTPANTTTQSVQIIETENRKTYQNNLYNFSIKYPSDWPVREPETGECDDNAICEIAIGTLPTLAERKTNHVSILIHPAAVVTRNNGKDGTTDCTALGTVTLDSGLSAEKKQCSGMDDVSSIYLTITRNGIMYQLINSSDSEEESAIFDEMANSFSF